MRHARRSFAEIWRGPMILAALTVAGLLAALLGQQGAWLPLCWALLVIPLLVIVYCLRRRQRVTTTGVPTETR